MDETKNGRSDSIWAVRRLSVKENQFSWTYLGDRPEEVFDFKIEVKKNLLSLTVNQEKVLMADISYWQEMNSYFKAGVYLQSMGTARAEFLLLTYESDPQVVVQPGKSGLARIAEPSIFHRCIVGDCYSFEF